MRGYICDFSIRLAVNDDERTNAVFQLDHFSDKAFTVADYVSRPQSRIDNANVRRRFVFGSAGLRGVVKR